MKPLASALGSEPCYSQPYLHVLVANVSLVCFFPVTVACVFNSCWPDCGTVSVKVNSFTSAFFISGLGCLWDFCLWSKHGFLCSVCFIGLCSSGLSVPNSKQKPLRQCFPNFPSNSKIKNKACLLKEFVYCWLFLLLLPLNNLIRFLWVFPGCSLGVPCSALHLHGSFFCLAC